MRDKQFREIAARVACSAVTRKSNTLFRQKPYIARNKQSLTRNNAEMKIFKKLINKKEAQQFANDKGL
jgi:hypothetical protein